MIAKSLLKFLFVAFILKSMYVDAQTPSTKKCISPQDFEKWYSLESYSLDNTGGFLMYNIRNYPMGHSTLIVQSVDGKWHQEILDAETGKFAEESPFFVYKVNDSIWIQKLKSPQRKCFINIKNFEICGKRLILNTAINDISQLRIFRFDIAEEQSIDSVLNFRIHAETKKILLSVANGKHEQAQVGLFDIESGKLDFFYTGWIPRSIVFDNSGKQVAILAGQSSFEDSANVIWYYNSTLSRAKPLVTSEMKGIGAEYHISNLDPRFNNSNDKLFIYIERNKAISKVDDDMKLDLWSYQDRYIQSEQIFKKHNDATHNYLTVFDINSQKLTQLESEDVYAVTPNICDSNNVILLLNKGPIEGFYESDLRPSFSLLDLATGRQTLITGKKSAATANEVFISPNEKYLLYYDYVTRHYHSYEINTGQYRNVTVDIPYPFYDDITSKIYPNPYGIAAWANGGDDVLIFDQFDIWMISLNNSHLPINLTKGEGRKRHLVFGLSNTDRNQMIKVNQDVLLTAFDIENKSNGFARLRIDVKGTNSFKIGEISPYCYQISRIVPSGSSFPTGIPPVRSLNKDLFLVSRMNATSAPNLFITRNFEEYKQITDLHPEKEYNWITNELLTWTNADGKKMTGILYKPENFDSRVKYPLIFTYYEKRSDELNEYLYPRYSKGTINIPSYVSNGYLVFVPDIYYECGEGNGEGALKSVLSSVKMLSQFSWFDSTRLGAQGHSHGGSQTNYLITHTSIFKAACESAGSCDYISAYGQIQKERGTARQLGYEIGYQGCGFGLDKTPWTATDLYVKYSPIFSIDKITTPLLILHNKNDDAVPFEQGLELFLGMKRAGKKVWMLQYDDGDHLVYGRSSEDFTLRMKQFFDFYLKNEAAPEWMSKGIPATLKGIESRLGN